jgi:hypothetical protein
LGAFALGAFALGAFALGAFALARGTGTHRLAAFDLAVPGFALARFVEAGFSDGFARFADFLAFLAFGAADRFALFEAFRAFFAIRTPPLTLWP